MSLSGSLKMLKSSTTNGSDSGSTKNTKFRFLSWSPETYDLRTFVNLFSLPRVVRLTNCEEGNVLKALVLPSEVDITQPLLLYKKYKTSKILGKCLKIQKNGKLKEVGSSLVIPDSFAGWFTLVSHDGKECAMTLTSMGQLAAARVPAFLTKFDLNVYKLSDSNEPSGKSVYVKSTIKGGSMLRLLGVWADLGTSNKPSSYNRGSGLFSGSLGSFGGRVAARTVSQAAQPPQFQYVQCINLENEVLFIPFTAVGVFYPIAPRGGRNPQHIYPLSAIARIQKPPLKIKMVHGTFPSNVPDFTGTLQIDSILVEDVILACTLMKEKPNIFEIDADCDLLLSQMASEDLFIQSTSYQGAINFCRNESENWRKQIRPLTFNLGSKNGKHGTVSGAYMLSTRNKSNALKLRTSTPSPSKLSLLFRPSYNPLFSSKDPLRRSKSFNVEIQSVSLSLQQDEDEEEKRLSTLFNFVVGRKNRSKQKYDSSKSLSQSQNVPLSQSNSKSFMNPLSQNVYYPDVLSDHKKLRNYKQLESKDPLHKELKNPLSMSVVNIKEEIGSSHNFKKDPNLVRIPNKPGDVPYGTVLDDVTEDENIYSEINDTFNQKLNLQPFHDMGIQFHRQLSRHRSASNMSSLLKGGGGSDGAFSGTLSGTFSSSNPSNREEDIYDSVF